MKKTLAFILVVIFTIALVLTEASGDVSGDYTYDVKSDQTATITRYRGDEPSIVLPTVLESYIVTEIDTSAFTLCDTLTSVTLSKTIRTIGNYTFAFCSTLSSIEVSPDNTYYSSIDGVLFRKADKTLLTYPAGKPDTTYSVPYGTLAIADDAFWNCESLTSVSLPDTLLTIGSSSFYGCNGLTSVTLPSSLQTVGTGIFAACTSLTSLTISPSNTVFTTIDGILFRTEDKALLAYPAGKTATAYTVPQGIQAIGGGAFSGCQNLVSITLPDTLLSIGDAAFTGCTSLTSINALNSFPPVTISDGNAGNLLTSNILPEALTSIGDYAFWGCSALATLGFSDTLQHIGNNAFYNCDALTLIVPLNSYAYTYAMDNEISYLYTNTLDWLNP